MDESGETECQAGNYRTKGRIHRHLKGKLREACFFLSVWFRGLCFNIKPEWHVIEVGVIDDWVIERGILIFWEDLFWC